MILTISWYGGAVVTLPDGSSVVTINFTYSTANGSCSALDFIDNGSSCQFGDGNLPTGIFFDYPTSDYYHNGLIYTQYAPRVWLPVITNATPSTTVSLPVYVNDFNNVRSFTLSFEYDNTVMTYSSFTSAADFGAELTATDSPSGTKKKVVMTWTGTANKTLPAGSLIGTVNFNFISGTSSLAWLISDGTS
jgi:hypothetical protein